MQSTSDKNILFQLLLQLLCLVPGAPGLTGLSVPRAVVEELRPGGDSVTVQPRPTVVQTVVEMTLNRESVTLRLVSKVKALVASLYLGCQAYVIMS